MCLPRTPEKQQFRAHVLLTCSGRHVFAYASESGFQLDSASCRRHFRTRRVLIVHLDGFGLSAVRMCLALFLLLCE
ncbi:hypothetical protein GY45DRAFT_288345 [Cubamyces sp. BRFM 1775]|nr:hypothetical protein GY45DRAFT_288345 [Cubamyces sp. BRFM 1775]